QYDKWLCCPCRGGWSTAIRQRDEGEEASARLQRLPSDLEFPRADNCAALKECGPGMVRTRWTFTTTGARDAGQTRKVRPCSTTSPPPIREAGASSSAVCMHAPDATAIGSHTTDTPAPGRSSTPI